MIIGGVLCRFLFAGFGHWPSGPAAVEVIRGLLCLCCHLSQSWTPINAKEEILVEQIAQNAWRLMRVRLIEAAMFTRMMPSLEPGCTGPPGKPRSFHAGALISILFYHEDGRLLLSSVAANQRCPTLLDPSRESSATFYSAAPVRTANIATQTGGAGKTAGQFTVTVFEIKVTSAFARALPTTVVPAFIVMAVPAMMFPLKTTLDPNVAFVPTCQNTLAA